MLVRTAVNWSQFSPLMIRVVLRFFIPTRELRELIEDFGWFVNLYSPPISSSPYQPSLSSGVRWSQIRRGNRLKPLKPAISESLERAYSTYVNQLRSGESASSLAKLTDVGRMVEVDFNQMMMLHPEQCELRRAFEPGVFLQYKTSPSQMQLHCKIFRIQVSRTTRFSNCSPVNNLFSGHFYWLTNFCPSGQGLPQVAQKPLGEW